MNQLIKGFCKDCFYRAMIPTVVTIKALNSNKALKREVLNTADPKRADLKNTDPTKEQKEEEVIVLDRVCQMTELFIPEDGYCHLFEEKDW